MKKHQARFVVLSLVLVIPTLLHRNAFAGTGFQMILSCWKSNYGRDTTITVARMSGLKALHGGYGGKRRATSKPTDRKRMLQP